MGIYIVGYDTVKLYYRKNFYRYISKLVSLVPHENGCFCWFRNSQIYFSFEHGMTTIRFSAAKVFNNGSNLELVGLRETQVVIQLISDFIKIDLEKFKVSRLHITSNILTDITLRQFYQHLIVPPYYKGKTVKRNGFYFLTNYSIDRATRQILFYKKPDSNSIRMEIKFEWVEKSGGSMNKLFKTFLQHSSEAENLLKESFYISCLMHFLRTIGQTLGKKPKNRKDKAIKDELFLGLKKNYSHSIHHLYTQW